MAYPLSERDVSHVMTRAKNGLNGLNSRVLHQSLSPKQPETLQEEEGGKQGLNRKGTGGGTFKVH